MKAKNILKLIFALLLSFVFVIALIACDDDEDLPVIDEDIHINEDGGIGLPIEDYDPNYQLPVG